MDKYKQHQNLIKKFKLLASKEIKGLRVFDQTVGLFYTRNGNPVKIGVNGMSDCVGHFPTGKGILMLSFEFKTGKARQSKDQKMWQEYIEKNNGLYIIVREDIESAIKKIKEHLSERGLL